MFVFWMGVLYFSPGWPGTLWLSLVSDSCLRFRSVNHNIQLLFSSPGSHLGPVVSLAVRKLSSRVRKGSPGPQPSGPSEEVA